MLSRGDDDVVSDADTEPIPEHWLDKTIENMSDPKLKEELGRLSAPEAEYEDILGRCEGGEAQLEETEVEDVARHATCLAEIVEVISTCPATVAATTAFAWRHGLNGGPLRQTVGGAHHELSAVKCNMENIRTPSPAAALQPATLDKTSLDKTMLD